MKERRAKSKRENEFVDEARARQENILWPGPVRNSRGVDSLLWKGSDNLTLVQRVAIFLFGICYLSGGLLIFIYYGFLQQSRFDVIFGALWLFLGVRVCWNAVRRRLRKKPE